MKKPGKRWRTFPDGEAGSVRVQPATFRSSSASILAMYRALHSRMAPPLHLQFSYLQRVERIRENPATAVGVITDKNCAQHGSRSYAFQVDSKTYDGGGSSGGNCYTVQIGGHTVVHYEKSNPEDNIGKNPQPYGMKSFQSA